MIAEWMAMRTSISSVVFRIWLYVLRELAEDVPDDDRTRLRGVYLDRDRVLHRRDAALGSIAPGHAEHHDDNDGGAWKMPCVPHRELNRNGIGGIRCGRADGTERFYNVLAISARAR
jgi:hypothetical protein